MPAESVSHVGTVAGQNRIRKRSPLRQTTANLQGLLSLCSIKLTHVCTRHMQLSERYNIPNDTATAGALSLMKLYLSLFFTLCNSVQQHRNLLIIKQPFLQKLDKNPVGEAVGAQLKGLGVLAPEQQEGRKSSFALENGQMSSVRADSKHLRGIAKDNVGCDSQDDVWSALIMNIPGEGGGYSWMSFSYNKDEAQFTAVTTVK